jgi:hypothetical protein
MFHLTPVSANAKMGPIPVSTSGAATCPLSCPLRGNGCYAELGKIAIHWRKISAGARGYSWDAFLDKVRALPRGQLWRHNQAGDLPGTGDTLDVPALLELVAANKGRRGFTYTQAFGDPARGTIRSHRQLGRFYDQSFGKQSRPRG